MKKIREIRIVDLIKYFLFPSILLSILIVAETQVRFLSLHPALNIVIYIVGAIASYPIIKKLVIGLVLLYKAFAPMSLRKQCRFEPTCSTYMVMAINKYGLFVGVYKGIRRIVRCCPPNGGIDYP